MEKEQLANSSTKTPSAIKIDNLDINRDLTRTALCFVGEKKLACHLDKSKDFNKCNNCIYYVQIK
ncbi:hypothetical protein PSMA106859_03410 [Pseudoalteromonas maricaloris]